VDGCHIATVKGELELELEVDSRTSRPSLTPARRQMLYSISAAAMQAGDRLGRGVENVAMSEASAALTPQRISEH